MTTVVSPAPIAAEEEPLAAAEPRTTQASFVILGFTLLMLLMLAVGKAHMVRLAYPMLALGLAAWLYVRGPGGYIMFAWWLWHVTPGIRRIEDYLAGGYDPQNPMSLTPFLVSALAFFGVLRRLPELRRLRFLPWGIAALALIYGYFVGLLRLGLMPATHALISWLIPLAFGLYCAVNWRRYPEVETAMRRAFLLGSVVLAIYGINQFMDPPEWDKYWMTNSGMYSVGRAFPYEVRVFSLVNAPLPFATILVAGLFLQLTGRGIRRAVPLALGVGALLLSLVRSVWVAGLVGLFVYLFSLPRRTLRPMVISGLVAIGVVMLAPVFLPDQIAGPTVRIVHDRLLTFTDLKHDVSYKDRASFLQNVSETVLREPFGHGLGSTGVSSTLGSGGGDSIRDFDNGVFAVFYSLGWVAGAVFLAAVLCTVLLGLPRREQNDDYTAKAARAVAVTSVFLAFGGNVFEGVSAACLWGFAGLLVAAHQWQAVNHDPEEVRA
jgi:O-antigen ligase/polysaccharide polymerase Wzy-like membrane protein